MKMTLDQFKIACKLSHRVWVNNVDPTIVAYQTYQWVDRVLILDEENGRKVLATMPVSEFEKLSNYTEKK